MWEIGSTEYLVSAELSHAEDRLNRVMCVQRLVRPLSDLLTY